MWGKEHECGSIFSGDLKEKGRIATPERLRGGLCTTGRLELNLFFNIESS